jgi:DNA repair exonuclease SbcCD ATPase subunit
LKRLVVCLALAWLSAGLPAARAQQDLTRDQVAAYVALTKADRARDRGDAVAAQAAYEDALAKYTAIKERDPRWHPDVVHYRVSYCLQQLDRLKTPPPPAAPEPVAAPVDAEPAPDVPAAAPLAESPLISAELESLRTRVNELQAALVVTQALAKLEQERTEIMAERDQLRARVTELESAPDPTVDLRATLEQKQAELTRLQAMVTEAEAGREFKAREADQLVQQVEAQLAVLRNAQTNVDQLREQLAGATASAEQAVKERDEARAALETERRERAAAVPDPAGGPEALKKAEAAGDAARRALAECQERAETRLKAYEAAQKERDELAPQVREARQQMAEMQSAIKALKVRESERTGDSKKLVADLRKEVARLKAGLPTPSDMEAVLTEQVESLNRQLRAVRAEAAVREERIQQLQREIETLKKAP